MTPQVVIAAGAQAAAQGLVRSALLTKLLPFAGAVSLLVGLFGRKTSTEIRPAAGNHNKLTRVSVPPSAKDSAQSAARIGRRGLALAAAWLPTRRVAP